jgi:hypothetical protein
VGRRRVERDGGGKKQARSGSVAVTTRVQEASAAFELLSSFALPHTSAIVLDAASSLVPLVLIAHFNQRSRYSSSLKSLLSITAHVRFSGEHRHPSSPLDHCRIDVPKPPRELSSFGGDGHDLRLVYPGSVVAPVCVISHDLGLMNTH